MRAIPRLNREKEKVKNLVAFWEVGMPLRANGPHHPY